jgi:hypothetical protein
MTILDNTTKTTKYKIYVADMAAYKTGQIRGVWIDATSLNDGVGFRLFRSFGAIKGL